MNSARKHVLISAVTSLITALVTVLVVNSGDNETSARFLTDATSVTTSVDKSITVTRSDINSQFTLPATVVPNPIFLLLSETEGDVSHAQATGLVSEGGSIGSVSGTAVTAPRQVELLRWLVPDGSAVSSGTAIAEVRLVGFAVEANVEASDSYRLLAGSELTGSASIDVGPGPFDCPIVQPSGTDVEESNPDVEVLTTTVLCLIPDEVRSVTDVPATLLVSNAVVENALILPVTAVRGLVDTGEVNLIENGSVVVQPVELGVTDGVNIEIVAGLGEGDEVSSEAPPLHGP